MIKEELNQEAEEYFKSICGDYNEEYERTGKRHYWVGYDIKNAYLASAESREKRIAELEQQMKRLEEENNELKEVHESDKRSLRLIAEKGAEALFKNSPEKLKMAKGNIGFMGVCAAAVFVIPALCSVVVKPFTDMIFKKSDNNTNTPEINTNTQAVKPQISHAGNIKPYKMSTYMNNGGLKI